ncbi:hypothetical protein BATDEDRAFT_26406 [Batrachochytrium dendrobatidis JAM81]|uniref:Uncharacterized protein n=2 Tax=Batrachochytrium dendrobatidis TaxID=109871 RepID=F4P7K5_BATDJ|nr:uncharacterized protein BATDEDRAFT_26406 [Batrachochytrium dendrobatidis JAM81]EGF78961.1 hypothetical protein BATDEDRAFT_26406 [Batrachochytrium dendrobatidis JAM81]OAJ42062.1 hypothetical protein BDEG_25566 [Batrachochytrium dendrobatidis JEL423]|eukprot:XP_006680373.1 hypothetical protein BATDEDRAFT_26406 [Batrachochytrium dendrobatidis JAM81]
MKLAVAVLSSILFACSVTIANPILPSETTSTESITSPTPNPNGIGLDGLNPLPDSIKNLLDKYVEIQDGFEEQEKICDSLKPQYDSQTMLVTNLETKIQDLEEKSQDDDSLKYYIEIRKTKIDLEAQKSKLEYLKKRYSECVLKKNDLKFGMNRVEIRLVESVFGTWNYRSLNQKIASIGTYPSVMRYFGELASKGQSSERNKSLNQKSGGRRKHRKPSGQQQSQDSQPSSSRPSGSGSLGRRASTFRHRASSGIRRGASRLVGNAGSLFQRPGDEDREPLIEH